MVSGFWFGFLGTPVKLETIEKALAEIPTRAFLLAYKDSNLNSQNQNLMCYRYTIGQTHCLFSKAWQRYNVFTILKSSLLNFFLLG